jgi:hypothetical protein
MTDKPKITDFNEAKKRVGAQKTDKSLNGSGARIGASGADAAYERALRKQKGVKGSWGGGVRWFHYIQLVFFLVLIAWFMKSCNF